MGLNLVMLGAPGAGKGTQADRLARALGIPKISTGDILREAVQARTEIGLRAKAQMDRGELVADDVIIGIVRDRLNRPDARDGFILDGFPRTVAQGIALDDIMAPRTPLIVIEVEVPEAELVRRLGARLICADCGTNAELGGGATPTRCAKCGGPLVQRADDSEAVVHERLKVYRRDTQPLVDYYRSRPTFFAIAGAQTSDRVAADIAAALEAVAHRGARSVGGPVT